MASTNKVNLSKAERREAAREEARLLREAQVRRERRNRTILVGALVGFIALAVVAVVVIIAQGSRSPLADVDSPAGANEAGGIEVGAAGVGAPNEGATVVQVYSDFICPYCALFETTNGATLEELAASGEATVAYHPVAFLDQYSNGTQYSTRAVHAVAVVADAAPDQFVAFNRALFENQPAENTDGLSDEEIAQIAMGVGVPQDVVDTFTDGVFSEWVTAATDQAARDLARPATPTILIDGEVFSGDWTDPAVFRAAVTGGEAAASAEPTEGAGSEPTEVVETPVG